MILRLGGEVTDLVEAEAEAGADAGDAVPATHLLCTAPARSQRILSSIAAGCWVLHPAYIARSAAAGTFLPVTALIILCVRISMREVFNTVPVLLPAFFIINTKSERNLNIRKLFGWTISQKIIEQF